MTRTVRSERGAALVEFALITPLMVMVLFSGVDFARAYYASQALTNAARAGAQYGVQQVTFNAAAIRTKALAASPSVTYSVDTPTKSCVCIDNTNGTVSNLTCGSTCASGSHQATFITVTAHTPFNTVTRIPGIPTGFTMTRTATTRFQ